MLTTARIKAIRIFPFKFGFISGIFPTKFYVRIKTI